MSAIDLGVRGSILGAHRRQNDASKSNVTRIMCNSRGRHRDYKMSPEWGVSNRWQTTQIFLRGFTYAARSATEASTIPTERKLS